MTPKSLRKIAVAASILLPAASTLVWTGTASAQEAMLRANNQIWLDGGVQNLNYRETTVNGNTDTEKGTPPVFALGISTQREVFGISNLYFSGSVRVAHGNTDYNGYLQNTTGGVVVPSYSMTTHSTTTDVTLKAGRALPFTLGTWNAQVIPYALSLIHI